jgi:6-phosphogluconolactonase
MSGAAHVYADQAALAQAAAELFAGAARAAVAARGRFVVALSGGATPQTTYEILAEEPWRTRVPWPWVHVFWGDERCVPPNDERSNERMARSALLDHVPVVAGQVHPIRCAGDPAGAAAQYEKILKEYFPEGRPRFDLVLLGLGTNGHTASLFPGTDVLKEERRWAAEVFVAEEAAWRVTLTAGAINAAVLVAFLVAGREKAEILDRVLRGPRETAKLPAQMIVPTCGELVWLVDADAAGTKGKMKN